MTTMRRQAANLMTTSPSQHRKPASRVRILIRLHRLVCPLFRFPWQSRSKESFHQRKSEGLVRCPFQAWWVLHQGSVMQWRQTETRGKVYNTQLGQHKWVKPLCALRELRPAKASTQSDRRLRWPHEEGWTGLQIKARIGELFSLFLIQNICCRYSKNRLNESFEHPKHV